MKFRALAFLAGIVVAHGVRCARRSSAGCYHEHVTPADNHEGDGRVYPDEMGLDERRMLDWRITSLEHAGFDELRAATLAAVGDWRKAIELVEAGCDHMVAADICL